jgi:CheY-like chemotaxis protein
MFPDTGKTLLVVEDNPIEREGLSAFLEQAGYRVVSAANSKEALERLRGAAPPDLLLLDMMMSEHDGWGYLNLVRRNPSLTSIPVIIVTGLGIATPEWATSLGAAGLVHKPVEVENLFQEIARVLGK